MKLTLVAYGTWGDVLPVTALAVGLRDSGHRVRLVVPQDFEPVVRRSGLEIDYLPVRNFVVMKRVSSETRPLHALKAIRDQIAPALMKAGEYLAETTDRNDALLANSWLMGIAGPLARMRGQQLIHLALQPRITTSQMPIATMPDLPDWIPFAGLYNRMTYTISGLVRWLLYVRVFDSIRLPVSDRGASTPRSYAALVSGTPSVTLVSPRLVPRPPDWAPHHRVTGFLFYQDKHWQPNRALVEFLGSDPPPLYVGFGSVHDLQPERTTHMLVEALRLAGQRAVLHIGWSGLGLNGLPASVHPVDYASHTWLFPRVSGAVHHAGAGTSAAALRAGVPSVPVPHSGDQHFWARSLRKLGVGTEPLERSRLSAQSLADRLEQAATDQGLRRRAREVGHSIRQEDGLGMAISAIEDFL